MQTSPRIEPESGSIVKTIGDAVMAVFREPAGAMRAVLRAHDSIGRVMGTPSLVLKTGIHAGACIAVTLNERLDYFGSTVNIAARIQGLSHGDDIVLSETVWRDPEVADWVAQLNPQLSIEMFQAQLKGVAGDFELWRVVHEPYSAPAVLPPTQKAATPSARNAE